MEGVVSVFGNPLLNDLLGDTEVAEHLSVERDIEATLAFEKALASALAEVGLIPPEAGETIRRAADGIEFDTAALARGVARDGVVVPDLVKQLRAFVGKPHAPHVHYGATSQDVIDTSLIVRLGPILDILEGRLVHLEACLDQMAAQAGDQPFMAKTRMQNALPIRLADRIESWRAPLSRHRCRLQELRPRLLKVQLGGPVGTLSEYGEHRDRVVACVAAELGLHSAPQWHSQRDALAEFASWLSLVTGSMGKIGQDIALMAQNAVGEVRVATSGGSSAMAHKANPVLAEILVTLARLNATLLGGFHQSLVHENERSGAAWTLEWLLLPQMMIAAGASLRQASHLLEGLSFPRADAQS